MPLEGRPLLRHVLDTAVAAGLDPIVLVTGPDEALAGIDLRPARQVVNAHPEEGLASSVRLGLGALDAEPDVRAAVILLGDQPRVRAPTIRALMAASAGHAPLIVPAYTDDDAPNPVVARRDGWRLADELAGDRGFGPLLLRHPELVKRVPIEGSNPDIDTPQDLAALERESPARAPDRLP
jgi:molybdenum cofactor cytidylyltransferase